MADEWKERLRQAVAEKHGGNMKAASLGLGFGETYIRDVLERGNIPSSTRMQKIADYFGRPLSWFMTGQAQVAVVPIVGIVAPGLWIDLAEYANPMATVPVPVVPGRYSHLAQSAYEIVGESLDRIGCPIGGYVITVDYDAARPAPHDGDIVVAERTDIASGMIERTVRVVRVGAASIRLESLASNGSAIELVEMKDTDSRRDTRILGLVIGYHRPITGL